MSEIVSRPVILNLVRVGPLWVDEKKSVVLFFKLSLKWHWRSKCSFKKSIYSQRGGRLIVWNLCSRQSLLKILWKLFVHSQNRQYLSFQELHVKTIINYQQTINKSVSCYFQVFLTSSNPSDGSISQKKLLRTLWLFIGLSIVWMLLSFISVNFMMAQTDIKFKWINDEYVIFKWFFL